ncbi:MAG: DMT family transporter, partial [Oscillospiraceae bacterium]|nr:DMT family transporter [Oscillospiraceae bacterium]
VINFDSSVTSNTYGIFSAFMSAVLYAGVMIFNKYFKDLSGIETTLVQMVSATVMLIVYVMVTEHATAFAPSLQEIIMLFIVGVIHTGFAYVIYFSSMQKMNTQNTAILSYIDPASALIFSTIFLKERMSIMGILGAVLILGGTIFSQLYKSKKEVEYAE